MEKAAKGKRKGSVTIFFSRPDDEKQVVGQECARGVVTEEQGSGAGMIISSNCVHDMTGEQLRAASPVQAYRE